EEFRGTVDAVCAQGSVTCTTMEELLARAGATPAEAPRTLADTVLVQSTSGSSGYSRGVRVSGDALRGNLTAMRRWLRWTPDVRGITWLPVHHDMGLVGSLMNSVVTGAETWMMQPEDFLRSPLRYLQCISDERIA